MARRAATISPGALIVSLGLASCPALDWFGARTAYGAVPPKPSVAAPVPARSTPEAPPPATRAPARREQSGHSPLEAESPGLWPEPTESELTALTSELEVDPERALASIAKETIIFAEPSWSGKKLGYLTAGAVVERGHAPASNRGCARGWYSIAPEGFVCVGKTATLDLSHPVRVAATTRPDRSRALPYVYGRSRFPTPPFYTRIPRHADRQRVEMDLKGHLRGHKRGAWDFVPFGSVPEFLRDGRAAPSVHVYVHSTKSIYTGRALPESGFAFLSFFESEGRRFGLSTDLAVMPLDRLKPVQLSEFHGLELDDDVTLPVAFVYTRRGHLYAREGGPGSSLKVVRRLAYREAVPITGKRVRIGKAKYYETRSGHFLRDAKLVRVDPMRNRPTWAKPGRSWIDVSILRQSLVAYEGTRPVFVTLVSTGVDGLGDPEETHSTIRGRFLIHTKHVTATMSGDEPGDEFDLRDVPYVQYFTEGYALHAAYWHDAFGQPRSHGCVNLSPRDARWLFEWSDPAVPQSWHGAMSLRDGTLVSIHP